MTSKAEASKLFPDLDVKKVTDGSNSSTLVEFKNGAKVYLAADGTERWDHSQTDALKPGDTADEDDK